MSDYPKFRGKCKEYSEALIAKDPTLTLVRGFYICPIWGEQQHFWVKDQKGNIIDPTKNQFPSRGCGDYIEWDNKYYCDECGKETTPETGFVYGCFIYCDYACACHAVGIS